MPLTLKFLSTACLGGVLSASCAAPGVDAARVAVAASATATFEHAGLGAGPVLFTDASGRLVEERRVEPFGVELDGADVVARDRNALGKRTDPATGWSDHGARWLVPETARWLSPDPPVEAPGRGFMAAPWALHPYQYVDQNPVAFWDPDGREPQSTVLADRINVLRGLLDRVPAGPARDAALAMWSSPRTIDQNGVRNLASGAVKVAYIEDLEPAPDQAAALASVSLPGGTAGYRALLHPVTGDALAIGPLTVGFQDGDYLFGSRGASTVRWRSLINHEQSHAWNHDSDAAGGSIERYRGEFRAYWVGEFSIVPDLDHRADLIKTHLLSAYPEFAVRCSADPVFKFQVDIHTRPSAKDNLDNHSGGP